MEDLDLMAEWVAINKKLEEGWAPLRPLVAQRDEIEKKISFLKNKGVSPFPPKSSDSAPLPSSSSMLLEHPSTPKKPSSSSGSKRKKSGSEVKLKEKIAKLKSSESSVTSPSETPISKDQTQNFPGDKN